MNSTAIRRLALLPLLIALGGASWSAPTPSRTDEPAGRAGYRSVAGLDEPLVAIGPTTAADDAALDAAIAEFRLAGSLGARDYLDVAEPLSKFVQQHPSSPWRMAIEANLGTGHFRAGYFSLAISEWRDAWELGKGDRSMPVRALADRAIGELARMYARLGDSASLDKAFADVGKRTTVGPGEEMLRGAHEARWLFEHQYDHAFMCGPAALKNLLQSGAVSPASRPAALRTIDDATSGPHGYTLAQLSRLADSAGVAHRIVYREPSAPIPVPSVIHWKLNHYAAIVEEKDGFYHVQDPTFASGDHWLSRRAIDTEASGFFLVPGNNEAGPSWRVATVEEKDRVFGMGTTNAAKPGASKTSDVNVHDLACHTGMCVANAKAMLVSLNLMDSPVGYTPATGPSARIELVYNQREASQPANFTFFNIGPKWTLNVLSWIQDDPAHPGQSMFRAARGGGFIDYSADVNHSGNERDDQSVLVRVPPTGTPTSYELHKADGSKEVFALSDGSQIAPRRLFLTQIVDASGNVLQLNYDAQLRLSSMVDAVGRSTTLSYEYPSNPLLVTRITDPFGRYASLGYDPQGRLKSIIDVLKLKSSFLYDAGDFITTLTTPYGTTRFAYGEDDFWYSRWLETTDPLGNTERVEFMHAAPGIKDRDPNSTVPAGFKSDNVYLEYRNTFFWDKNVYPKYHSDYTKARRTHWLHDAANTSLTSGAVESVKGPLSNRIWYAYRGQANLGFEGEDDRPMRIARVIDNGQSQESFLDYNVNGSPFNKPTGIHDASGRYRSLTWAGNDIDLLSIRQLSDPQGDLGNVATFSDYDANHHPQTVTDAAGQSSHFQYDLSGHVQVYTDPLNFNTQVLRREFDRPYQVFDANRKLVLALSYDGFDRVEQATDSETYTLHYQYDDMDRPVSVSYPDGTSIQYKYKWLDLESITDRQNRVTHFKFDANRQLRQVIDPLNQVTKYDYYPNGALMRLTDPRGNVTSWDVDIEGRPTAKHYAGVVNPDSYAYWPASGLLRSVTDALEQTTAYTYGLDDRVVREDYTNAQTATPSVTFAYDPYFLRLSSMTDGIGQTVFNYYPLGVPGALRLAGEDGPYTHDVQAYTYDKLGRVASRAVDGDTESFLYDPIGRLQTHSTALGNFTLGFLGETNQLTSEALPGLAGTSITYEGSFNDRRMKAIANTGARGYQFTTDTQYNFKTINDEALPKRPRTFSAFTPRTWTLSYDDADRLKDAALSPGGDFAYGYDKASNITSWQTPSGTKSAQYGKTNQLQTLDGVAVMQDADGNTIDDGVRTYQWDAANRLVAIGYHGNPTLSSQFRYDGLGRRVADVESSNGGSTETRYTWCGDRLCQARDGSDNVTRRYLTEGESRPQTGDLLYYDRDQIGSVRDVTSVVSGSIAASFDYDPYGNLVASSGATTSSDFRFAGMQYHVASGLYLTAQRIYDPYSARWLSRDPLRERAGINLYAYVAGNPISRADPTGTDGVSELLKFLGVVAGPGGLSLGEIWAASWAVRLPAIGGVYFAGKTGWQVGTAWDSATAASDTRYAQGDPQYWLDALSEHPLVKVAHDDIKNLMSLVEALRCFSNTATQSGDPLAPYPTG